MRGQRIKRKVIEALFSRYRDYNKEWFYTQGLSDDTNISNKRVGWLLKVLCNAKLVERKSLGTSHYRLWKVLSNAKIEDAERVLFGKSVMEENAYA